MGVMGISGRMGIILLAMAFLAPCVLISEPAAAVKEFAENSEGPLGATQYDPSIVFQSGVCFNDHSWAVSTDPGIVDFAMGDLNGDGLKDLALISDQTHSICIYNRTNDGKLNPIPWRITLPNILSMRSIAIGKLDLDGFDDIAVSYVNNDGDGRLSILFHSSHFTLAAALTKDVSSEPQKTIIGNFDHLGNASIMTLCMGSPLFSDDFIDIWRYPFGVATSDRYYFQIFAAPQFTKSKYLSSGDINGDGYSDIVVGNASGSDVLIALQSSSWKSAWTVSTKPISGEASDVALADVVGDTKLDLLYANSQNSRIYTYRNTGSGPLFFNSGSETPLEASTTLSSLAIGEFSFGPKVDILALSDSNNASAFMRSSGSWFTASPSLRFPVNANPLKAIVDRSIDDEDGVFVLCRGTPGSNGSIEFFKAHSSLQGNADQNIFSTGKNPTVLETGVLLNGNVMVAATLPDSHQVQVFERNTSKIILLTTPSTPLGLAFGNFDGDGNDDLAVLCEGLQVSIYPGYRLMNVAQPIKNVTLAISSPQSILAADLRGNGRSDLIVSYDGGCQIIYNSLASEPFNSTPLKETIGIGINGLRTAIFSADLFNDSHGGDLAILNEGTSKVEIYRRNNLGSPPNIYPNVPTSTLSVADLGLIDMTGADLGGLSTQDIAVTDDERGVHIFVQPSYGFTINLSASEASFYLPDNGERITSGDLNDDGMNDLIIGYETIPSVAAFLQKPESSFINIINLTGGGKSTGIIAKDIDGDIRDDVVSASPASHSLSIWYQNNLEPVANATPSSYSENEGALITFSGSGSKDSYSDQLFLEYDWTFFDPITYENGITVTHFYPQNGTYHVNLRATDRGGLSSWSNLTITIIDTSPTADFSYMPESPIEGTLVQFTDTSIPGIDPIISYHWTFGDGGVSDLRNASHIYLQNGSYPVTLTLRDADGSESTSEKTIIVTDTNPVVDFWMSPNPALEGTEVNFIDLSMASSQDPIFDRFWTFGDGGSDHGFNVNHTYAQNGTYHVTLQVNDSDGPTISLTKNITITDADPSIDFNFDPLTPIEGQSVQFIDQTTSYDGIVNWLWDFDDGSTSNVSGPTHVFTSNGTYNVSLMVWEPDGSSATAHHLVQINDTSPSIISVRTADGRRDYLEDQTILFEVTALPGFDPLIVGYQWDLNFNGSFTKTPLNSLVNHTSYQFTKSGTYEVSVRVWDHDSYREATSLQVLVIDITDPPPIASFNFHNVSSGTIQLDASSSSDNPSDVNGLLFSWNFDDGGGDSIWTNTTRILTHHFALDGEYSIKLRVKDDSNQTTEATRTILIDRTAPEIVLSGESTSFFVGEAIQISVTVHDPNGISAVTLHYRIDNASEQALSMTPSGSGSIYVAQIPPQSHNCTIDYWVTASDDLANVRTTGQLVITVNPTPVESQNILFILSVVLILVAIMLLFVRNAIVPVDEVFIIYNDGRLMAHQTRRLKPGMDDEILSSMLVAIQGFVKDSFKDESSTHLQRLDFGEKKILVERGDSFYLAVVLHSNRAGNVPQRMQAVIEDIHKEYGQALNEWDGDLEKVRGVKDQTGKLFKSPIPLALPGLKKVSVAEDECPACGKLVPANEAKCPLCGVELSHSSLDEFEEAKSLEEPKDGVK